MKCESCPANCLGQTPEFAVFCEWWASGDPVRRAHVANRSALGLTPAPAPDPAPAAVPRAWWPLPLAMISMMAREGDRGIGDTVARIFNPLGGDAWKEFYRRMTGSECGCEMRQSLLNERYPYG